MISSFLLFSQFRSNLLVAALHWSHVLHRFSLMIRNRDSSYRDAETMASSCMLTLIYQCLEHLEHLLAGTLIWITFYSSFRSLLRQVIRGSFSLISLRELIDISWIVSALYFSGIAMALKTSFQVILPHPQGNIFCTVFHRIIENDVHIDILLLQGGVKILNWTYFPGSLSSDRADRLDDRNSRYFYQDLTQLINNFPLYLLDHRTLLSISSMTYNGCAHNQPPFFWGYHRTVMGHFAVQPLWMPAPAIIHHNLISFNFSRRKEQFVDLRYTPSRPA